MKQNCFNCRFLDWGSGDVSDPEGWVCERKYFNETEESEMLKQMSRDEYLNKSKVCWRPRGEPAQPVEEKKP